MFLQDKNKLSKACGCVLPILSISNLTEPKIRKTQSGQNEE